MTGCQRNKNLDSVLNLEKDVKLKTTFKNNCEYDMDIYYQNENNRMYLNCIESIDIIDEQNRISLKEYLDKEEIDINYLLSKIYNLNSNNNDGNVIYKDKNIIVISCNSTYSANKDIVIGNVDGNYDMAKICQTSEQNLKVTAVVTELYEDDMIVENVNDNKDKYNITRISVFEKKVLNDLKVGSVITFLYNGNRDLTDPPKIRVSNIKIVR